MGTVAQRPAASRRRMRPPVHRRKQTMCGRYRRDGNGRQAMVNGCKAAAIHGVYHALTLVCVAGVPVDCPTSDPSGRAQATSSSPEVYPTHAPGARPT